MNLSDENRKTILAAFISTLTIRKQLCTFNMVGEFVSEIPGFFSLSECNFLRIIRMRHNMLLDLLCQLQEENAIILTQGGERFILRACLKDVVDFDIQTNLI